MFLCTQSTCFEDRGDFGLKFYFKVIRIYIHISKIYFSIDQHQKLILTTIFFKLTLIYIVIRCKFPSRSTSHAHTDTKKPTA